MKTKDKVFYIGSMFTIVIAFFVLIWYFYEFIFPITVIKANVQPYKVLTPVVQVGGNLTYEVNACKYYNIQATVIRTYEDGIAFPSISATNNIPIGCHTTEVTIPVPNYITPGNYFLELDARYQINSFRTEEAHFRTESFKVIQRGKEADCD